MGNNGSTPQWRELSGENNWADLLHPLNIDLRKYIILYGDLAASIVAALNDEKASKWYGFSRFPKKDFFSKVGTNRELAPMYEVTKFIYATSDLDYVRDAYVPKSNVPDAQDSQSACMGFVAVSTEEGTNKLGRRDIVIVWRGTITSTKVENNSIDQIKAASIFGEAHDPKVNLGWYSLYTSSAPGSTYSNTSARVQVHDEITRLMNVYQEDSEISITLAGHSLGSALATLNAVDIANGYHGLTPLPNARKDSLISAFLLGSPRVGDEGFKKVFEGLDNLHALRITNLPDDVPNFPPKVHLLPFAYYSDVGQELQINTRLSQYLKDDPKVPLDHHSLQIYLHGIAGTQGTGNSDGFSLEVHRALALVNTSLDGLKDEYVYKYRVPVSWWVEEKKCMVRQDDGKWKLVDEGPDDE